MYNYMLLDFGVEYIAFLRIKNTILETIDEKVVLYPVKILFNCFSEAIIEFKEDGNRILNRTSSLDDFVPQFVVNEEDVNSGAFLRILEFQDDKSAELWFKLEYGL